MYQGTCEGQAAQPIARKDIQCFQFKYLTPRLCLPAGSTPKYCLLFKVFSLLKNVVLVTDPKYCFSDYYSLYKTLQIFLFLKSDLS